MILEPRQRESSAPQLVLGEGSPLFLAFQCPTHLNRAARVHGRWTRQIGPSRHSFDSRAWAHAQSMGDTHFQRFVDWYLDYYDRS